MKKENNSSLYELVALMFGYTVLVLLHIEANIGEMELEEIT